MAAALQDQWSTSASLSNCVRWKPPRCSPTSTRGSFQLYTLRWIGANNDPDIFEFVFSSKKIPPNGANRGRYRNPQLDALLDQARSEMDPQKRKQFFGKFRKLWPMICPT